jgi:hypothetical protein
MKSIVAILLAVAASATPFTAAASSEAYCYGIVNSNARYECLAKVRRQDSYCYSISNQDTKNACLAQVRNQRSYCYSISNQDTKNACLATVR